MYIAQCTFQHKAQYSAGGDSGDSGETCQLLTYIKAKEIRMQEKLGPAVEITWNMKLKS